MKREKGITLIALIITIVILVILTAITINNVMGSDLFGLARKAAIDTSIEGEREYLTGKTILSYLGEEKIGEKLEDKKAFGEGSWHIVTELEGNKKYGTDWYYLGSGTEVGDYGRLKYNWVVNYKTGEVEYLGDSNNYVDITDESSVGVKEGIIFNADGTLTDEILQELKEGKKLTQAEVGEKLGEGVSLHNFDDLAKAFEGGSFNFDGINDYITVPYDRENPNKKIDKGLTYEFYGKINGKGKSYMADGTEYKSAFDGLFCLWNGNESKNGRFRFGMVMNDTSPYAIQYNAGFYRADSCFAKATWNQLITFSNYNKTINYGEEIYLTVTIDGENNLQAIYINGELLKNGDEEAKGFLDTKNQYWKYFIDNELPNVTTFCLGRCTMDDDGYWHYSNTSIYALRLYNRGLTEEEVMKNYVATTTYRNSVVTE